jgi:hypothetical protein
MKNACALSIITAALICGAATSAGGLEIEGSFQLGNLGITPATVTTYTGADFFWGGHLSLRQDLSNSLQFEAALQRDPIVGNSVSALLQYKSDYLRVGVGPYLGLLNSRANTLNSGISTLLGVEIPGVAFLTLRTDSSLAGANYFAQSNEIDLGFYIRDSAICSLGVLYQQSASAESVLAETLTSYFFDVKVFEKNVPYRLDFSFAYQVLDGLNPLGTLGVGSVIVGAGIDLLFSESFALTLGFRTSVYSFEPNNPAGPTDIGFSPLLFQGSAGFRVTLADAPAAGQ